MKRGSLIRHFEAALLDRFRVWRRIGTHSVRGRRIRRIGFIAAIVVLVYGLVGFVGVPLAVYHIVAPKLSESLHRPVSVGRMRFNPYRLKVDIQDLHVGDRPPTDYSAAKPASDKTASDKSTPEESAPGKTASQAPAAKFVDIGHIRVKASWTSLFRLAPVVAEVTVERPRIHLVRDQYGGFNFSDLIAPATPPPKPAAPSAPMKFAVSNIRLSDGDITFDDRMLDEQHSFDKIQLGVPFLANLPADVDIFVQPLLKVVIDGSPLRITGQSKPFQATLESSIDLRLHRLEIPKYLGYVPVKLPVKTPTGFFSCDLSVHFVNVGNAPTVKVNGRVAVEKLAVTDWSKVPVLELERAATTLDDIEPLGGVFHVGRIYVDTLATHLFINPDGTNNLAELAKAPDHPAPPPPPPQPGSVASPAATSAPATIAAATMTASKTSVTPAASTTPAVSATPGATASASTTLVQTATPPPPDVSLESLLLVNSSADVTDNRIATPAKLALNAIHIDLNKFQLAAKTPAPFNFAANLADGGKLSVTGGLDVADTLVTTDVKIDELNLPPMQAFAPNAVTAQLAAGKLSAQAKVRTDFGPNFNVHVEPATASLDNFEIRAPREKTAPLAWKRISAAVEHVDLAAREAAVGEVRIEGMRADVAREHNGKISLLELINPPPPPVKKLSATEARAARHARIAERRKAPPARARKPATARRGRRVEKAEAPKPETPAAPQWKYTVASVVIADLGANVEDRVPAQSVKIAIAPLNLHLKDVSGDLSKPIALELDAAINKTGAIKVSGPVTIVPLKAELKVETKQLNLAVANPYLGSSANATLAGAALTMDGTVALASVRDKMHVKFGGNVLLGAVNLLDKLTGDEFARWQKLSIEKIDAEVGDEKPKVHVGSIALSDFYVRLILNSDGKLNLKDITGSQQAAPTSLTRAEGPSSHQAQAAAPPTPAPTPEPTPAESGAQTPPAPAEAPKPIDADLEISQIVLKGGNINYTDNFIKPNYTANLTQVAGKVGAFGTASTSPADVLLDAQLNDSSPIDIVGSINPLAPMASVDIKAKANGIELTELSAYSTRYTGYPIEKGTLTVDVHYNLNQGNLTAENHIFIDQLTFGDRVADSTAANLPIRLAVALLKNSKGEIDLHVPISGSLNDPQFSIGGVILHVITNLIMRAVTSPFSLIASAMGGSGGEELSYVEFKPGFSNLTPETQKKLDAVAEALKQKEGLKLMITGRVDPAQDRDGLREAAMVQAMKEQKFKDVGSKEGAQDADNVVIDPKEYDKYLEQAYKAAKFDKPRNAIGFAKSIPPDEMKKLMLQNAKVTDADLPKLATARSSTVRRYLSTKIDPVRLHSGAPKLTAEGIEDKGPTTRAELSLQ